MREREREGGERTQGEGGERTRGGKTPLGFSSQKHDEIHTIFIDGLHPSIDAYCLGFMCKNFGVVIDAYIPQKLRRVSASRFGFIRFRTKIEALRTIRELNGTRRFGRVITVSLAKYDRRRTEGPRGSEKKVWEEDIHSLNRKDTFNNGKTDYKTFSEAVKGSEIGKQDHIRKISVVSKEKEWLRRVLVGTLPNNSLSKTIGDICRSEGVWSFDIKPVGGPFVLLVFEEEIDMKEMLNSGKDWLMNWFVKVEPWTEKWSSNYRFAWLTCVGIPIHGWDLDTFYKIGNQWGEFIEVDDSTREERNLDRARILISTSHSKIINEQLELKVDNNTFSVRIMEEVRTELQMFVSRAITKNLTSDEDEQSSQSNEESSRNGYNNLEGSEEVEDDEVIMESRQFEKDFNAKKRSSNSRDTMNTEESTAVNTGENYQKEMNENNKSHNIDDLKQKEETTNTKRKNVTECT